MRVMGRLALLHRGRAKILPPLELLEPSIDRTATHWYWLESFYDDGLDRSAEFVWAAPAESSTRFMVPRLLWQLTHPEDVGKRLLLENTCGLFTCINPAHWRDRHAQVKIPARIVLPDSVEAMPVMYSPAALTVHIRWNDAITTICGHGPKHHGMAKPTVITCEECITTWVKLNQPYKESV
jgi:hypothetical protein